MTTAASTRFALLFLLLPLLAACPNDSDTPSDGSDRHAMTAEKYRLIGQAIGQMVDAGQLPSGGRFVIADQTTISDLVEDFLANDDTLDASSALDSVFPVDSLAWSLAEADLAFVAWIEANVEPARLELDGLDVLERDVSLLMHEQFKDDFVDGPIAGWQAFYDRYPDAAGYLRFGNPVIFRDAGFALVHVDFGCGPLCGIGMYLLFRFENGEWHYADQSGDWTT